MGEPDVSVIVTVYNGEAFLAESIGSVLAQTGVDFEVVIVDDGSTDSTDQILSGITDPRVVSLRRPRLGRAAALNEAIAHSRGTYLTIHDADDRSLPGRLTVAPDLLDQHPEVDLVGSGLWVFIDEHGSEVGRRPVAAVDDAGIRRLLQAHHAPFAHSSVTMRRTAWERVGGYDPELIVDLDIDLYVRIAADGRLTTVPEALVAVRRHRGQYFNSRRGPTRNIRRRIANRGTIDQRATALGGTAAVRPRRGAATARELASWVYWRARRLAGPQPILPASVRRRLDHWWSSGRRP